MKYTSNLISIVVPCYNEADSIIELFNRINAVFDKLDFDYELILVNDGSTDHTSKIISEINSRKIVEIKLKTNSGKSAAIMAGFTYATGVYIVTMDADLQDIPEDIPNFINKIKNGYDLVTGYRINRKDSIIRKIGSRIVNLFLKINSGLKIREHNCGFKIYSHQLAKSIYIYGHLHRFIPLIANSKGYKVCEIGTTNHARRHGKSKYKAIRYEALFDYLTLLFITRQSTTPMHVFGKLSLLLIIPSIAILLYLFLNIFYFY